MSNHQCPYTSKNKPSEETVPYKGANFHTLLWAVPQGVVRKARIIFVHGFSEHEVNYFPIFDDLSFAGYEIFFFDQRGSGHTSPGKTRGHTNEFQVFDDLDFFIERNLKELDNDTKLFMGGHSMGGGIALNYGIHGRYRERLSGIYTTGPLVMVHPDTLPNRLVVAAGKAVAKLWPTMKMNTDINIDYVTSNKAWHDFILHDPLQCPAIGTLRQLQDFIARGEKLLRPEYGSKFDTVPLLILHGSADKVNDPEASRKFYDIATVEDKKIFFLPNCGHCMHVEADEHYTKHKQLILEFLDSH